MSENFQFELVLEAGSNDKMRQDCHPTIHCQHGTQNLLLRPFLAIAIFKIKPMKPSPFKTEVAAGITTFFTMVYIIIVNPSVLSSEGVGMPFSGVLTATVTLAFFMTLLMGIYAKLPFAVAPGMGINTLFAYTIILRNQVPWPIALGIVFWSGVVFLICSLTSIRIKIADAIPHHLRFSASTGIGIFLTFIGLKNAGLIIQDPVTLVRLGNLNRQSLFVILGFSLMILLLRRKNPFAFLSGIGLITFLGYLDGQVHLPSVLWSKPDFNSVFLKLDLKNSLQFVFIPSIVAILFTDLFDSISAFMSCSQVLGLKDNQGQPKNLRQGLIVDSLATACAGLLGTSSGVTFIESAAGIEVGGRTGVTAIVTALCFIPCLFLAPLAGMAPLYATAPILILIGALMFKAIKQVKLDSLEDLIPAFLTIVLIPLSFSITQGILWGLISHVGLYVASGRRKEIKPMLYALASISLAMVIFQNSR